ncbi:ribonuclease HI family protein [Patescibacteria group bacterium]|nr:ribonuclease HI family protein [Patescibacteria group bacterium]
MTSHNNLIIRTDGGARGNPGPAAIGVVIETCAGQVVKKFGRYIGKATNNQAEYQALLAALQEVQKLKAEMVTCYLDSELVVKQLNREYRVKDQALAVLFIKIWNLSQGFKKISFHHVLREHNKAADALVNEALDKQELEV